MSPSTVDPPRRSPRNSRRSNSPPRGARRRRRALFVRGHATMSEHASELARRLAHEAEAVCRHYLSNGRREGRYWLVGDVRNTPGRSLFVRLNGANPARARPENGPTPPPAITAIFSMSSARAAASSISTTSPTRRGASLACRDLSRTPTIERHESTSAPDRIVGIRTAALRHVAADFGHDRRSVSARTRHYGFARNRSPALPSALLLSAGRSTRRPRPGRR